MKAKSSNIVSVVGDEPTDNVKDPSKVAGECSPDAHSVCTLADFERRVIACETPGQLDLLHSLMLRKIPVSERPPFVALLNQRDEALFLQDNKVQRQE